MRININKYIPPFLLGFLALSFQILLLREFSAHFYGNEVTYGLLLGSWFLWGSLGSISAKKIKFNFSRFITFYYTIILLFALCLITLRFSRFLLKILPGEITGMISVLIFSLILCFFISYPLGILFVFNTHFLKGDLPTVYLLESLGSSIAGLTVYFLLIPSFSNWHGTVIMGIAVSFISFLSFGKRKLKGLFIMSLVFLCFIYFFDFPSQKIYWKPYNLIESKDSPFGKLHVIETEEQISLYDNNLLVYSYPDLETSEESVHFGLLQNPQAKDVLMIGGGAGGSLEQALKYPSVKVDYVELDPEIIRLSLQYLPKKEQKTFKNSRIQIYYSDGRSFLDKVKKSYDAIILNLPDPSTALLNRFYTKEFFSRVKDKMREGGVFSLRVSSAENYISPERQNFLASIYHTLKEIFPEVVIVPGNSNIFLASFHPISIDYQEICKKIEILGLKNIYVSPQILLSRLDPFRIDYLKEKIYSGGKTLNLDLTPISYFYHSVLWSTHFRGLEKRIFSFFSNIKTFWILDFPLIFFILLLVLFVLKRKKSSFLLVPLMTMGFTSIVAELIVIISYQTRFGYLYQKISLLFASFMIGLFFGAYRGKKRKKIDYLKIIIIQSCFMMLVLLLILSMKSCPYEFIPFIFLLLLGFLGGDLFIVSNSLFLRVKKNYGLGYGLDLFGSFFGAIFASSILIPLVGLPLLLKYIFLLNSFCFLFLLVGLRK